MGHPGLLECAPLWLVRPHWLDPRRHFGSSIFFGIDYSSRITLRDSTASTSAISRRARIAPSSLPWLPCSVIALTAIALFIFPVLAFGFLAEGHGTGLLGQDGSLFRVPCLHTCVRVCVSVYKAPWREVPCFNSGSALVSLLHHKCFLT